MNEQIVREKASQFIETLRALEAALTPDNYPVNDPALDALVSLFAADAHLTNSALKLTSDERVGTDQIRSFWSDYKKTLGKAHSHFHQITVNQEAAGLFWTTTGTDADGTEEAVHYDGTTLLVFDNEGRIRFFQGYYDTRELSREIGTGK